MRKAAIALTAFLGGLFIVLGLSATSASAQEGGEALKGKLISEGKPVPGVHIIAKTEEGGAVGEATSDASGNWLIDVPGPGQYVVTLDAGSLPEGIGLINKEQGTLHVQVYTGNVRTVLFRLAPGGVSEFKSESKYSRIPQLLFEGFNLGLIIALAAVGLSLIYGTTGLTNFAHGELVTFGALMAFWFSEIDLPFLPRLDLIFAAVLAVCAAGLFGYSQDRWFWSWLRRRNTGLIGMMIVSIGLAIVLRNVFQIRFGGGTRQFTDYATQPGTDYGPITTNAKTFIGMGVAIVVILAIGFALLYTRLGKATRAVADNPALAAASGIDVDRVIRVVWTLGAAVAGLGGIILGMGQGVSYLMGFQILLLVFAGVTLGGLGTAFGALVGSLVVGLFVQLSTLWVAEELKIASALLLMIIVLLIRPQGILGRRERVG